MLKHRTGPFRAMAGLNLALASLLPLASIALDPDKGSGGGDAGGGDGKTGGTDDGGEDGDGEDGDDNAGRGFPAKTPWRQMKPEEQSAYWQHQAKKHERVAKANSAAATERDELKAKHQTAEEKQLDEAKKVGRAEAMQDVVEARLAGALAGRMGEEAAEELASSVNHTRFLGSDGKVDTTKVREWVDKVAPKAADDGKDKGKKVDTGGGKRGAATGKSGRDAGLAEAERRGYRKPAATT